ncbi:STAS domain-containing protein [Pseudidiomarina sp. 1APP75-32.1]|uniref:STAS domain-containing protein n=1 Tax=Pseudidiomarina terrestris TaxID=2820060 RepID=A0AAW7QZJ7_9GAMM|nr:STAS domain-containing protein [Pseudidiomarina sp. 1APP75-32.1]MDN7124305.1 STAS domain-containing protein [Pseudidiomarina sp. 1APP75-32.1]
MTAQLSWQQEDETLTFKGELTRATVARAWRQRKDWYADGQERLTVDLESVEHVDSAGVAMLLQLKKYLMQRKCELAITNPSQQFDAIVEVSGGSSLLKHV